MPRANLFFRVCLALFLAACAEPPPVERTRLPGGPGRSLEFARVELAYEEAFALTHRVLTEGSAGGPYPFEGFRILRSDPDRGFIEGVFPRDPDASQAGQRREIVHAYVVPSDETEEDRREGRGPFTEIHVTVDAPSGFVRRRPAAPEEPPGTTPGEMRARRLEAPFRPVFTGDLVREYSREWPDRRVNNYLMRLIARRIEEAVLEGKREALRGG